MIRDISNEIVVSLKDRLRDVRHLIRANRQAAQPAPQTLPDILFGKAARAVDKALTTAETISISLVSHDPAAHTTTIEARSLDAYFPTDNSDGEALFRRDVYYLTKRLLSILGSDNALIHEATFSAVHAKMICRHAARLRAAMKEPRAERYRNSLRNPCVRTAIATTDPNRGHCPRTTQRNRTRRTVSLCFSSIALAIGLATYADHEPGEEKLVESALLALQARQEKFDYAIAAPDRIRALSDLFAFLIPHLP